MGIQKLIEAFKEAYNQKGIDASTYLDFDADFKLFKASAGKAAIKKEIVTRLQKLYKETLYNKSKYKLINNIFQIFNELNKK